MNRACTVLLLVVGLVSAAAFAQVGPPKPGPEVKKLEYFLGKWDSTGDAKPGPMGPGGPMTMQSEGKWMDGGFFVATYSTWKSPMGDGSSLSFLGYDAMEKVYTYAEFNSMGEAVRAKGNLEGDTWTWTSEMKMGPQTIKTRYTQKILSPTAYSFKFEMSPDGTTWNTLMDGKASKKQPLN